jgi:RNA polymerase sigma-70 factor (ECF subfamily)
MHPDDAAVVAQARDGDEEAFRLLVERHSRAVYRLAMRMTGSAADAEDIVQDTFIRAHRQLHHFQGRAGFGSWLYRIAANCAIDHARRQPRHRWTESESDQRSSRGPSADDLVYAGEVSDRLQRSLRDLSDQERAAFLLRHEQGCSIDEISEALGVGREAAKHAIFRGVKKMRQALAPLLPARTGTP